MYDVSANFSQKGQNYNKVNNANNIPDNGGSDSLFWCR